ncbi:MAG: von Willebrand factor type A domain-containing protein [Deltaproteobacteria bacterium]|nr:von Willebrand factor type A domain-containing protein [Deltaproteobacteria bacterium]
MRKLLLLGLVACGGGKYMVAREAIPSQPFASVASPEAVANSESYTDYGKNPWIDASKDHLSTFAADVDTASFAIARTKLNGGALPPPASVRVEEWVNYFHYSFPAGGSPFAVVMDAAQHPFAADRYVLRVGVATRPKPASERKPSHLVFLVDVSGSMDEPAKLPLVKQSLHILTDNLSPRDSVSLVTYAGATRLVLPMTSIENKVRIHQAIDALSANGSTAMASGIDLAYDQAEKWLRPGEISRVIVCTDGDANVGPHSTQELLGIIEKRAQEGVALSTIGFGMGNYKDSMMEQLADKGNGNNYYIDSPEMAKRVFADQLTSTIETAAKDVKLQVDFDPTLVSRYRLIGYENRDLADKDFRKDDVPAGQVGWGHQVTAMYEVELTDAGKTQPFGVVRVRHKQPEGTSAVEDAFAMPAAATGFDAASQDLRFAFAVAAFADVMRGGAEWPLDEVRGIAQGAAGDDKDRVELVSLIDKARALRPAAKVATPVTAAAIAK